MPPPPRRPIETPEPLSRGYLFGILAFLAGLVAFFTSCIIPIAVPAGLLAVVFGVLSLKTRSHPFGVAGVCLGICPLIYHIYMLLPLLTHRS
jgi:hypothetical protein